MKETMVVRKLNHDGTYTSVTVEREVLGVVTYQIGKAQIPNVKVYGKWHVAR